MIEKFFLFIFIILFSPNVFSETFKIYCYPDNTLKNNIAGGNFTLVINEEPNNAESNYVYKSFDNSYVQNFEVFNEAAIIFKVPSGDWAIIDRISGHYKITNTPTDAFSNSVWKCEKIESAF